MQKPIDDHIPAPDMSAAPEAADTCTCTCAATSADKAEDALDSVKADTYSGVRYETGSVSC